MTENPSQAHAPESARARRPVERVLNVPFLIGSILVLVLGAGALYGIRTWQVGRTAVALLHRADQLEAEEKWFDAADNIQHYLLLVPNADEQRVRLALMHEKGLDDFKKKEHDFRREHEIRNRAIGLFYRAIGTGLTEEESLLRRKLAHLLIESRRYSEAQSEAEKLLSAASGDAEGLELRAKALWGLWQAGVLSENRTNRAATIGEAGTNVVIVSLEDAVAANPQNVELAVALATAYRDLSLKCYAAEDRKLPRDERGVDEVKATTREALATSVLDDLVKQNPSAETYLARYQYAHRWGLASASNDIEQAKQLAPENIDVLLAAAQAARLSSQKFRDKSNPSELEEQLRNALDLYQQVLDAGPSKNDALVARLGLGESHMALGEREKGIGVWEEGLAKCLGSPFAVEFEIRLAAAWLEDGKLAKAEKMMQTIRSDIDELPHHIARETIQALKLDQDLRWGVLEMRRQKPAAAIPHLQKVVVLQEQIGGKSEQSVRALLMLGSAYAAIGDWNQSAESYDRAILQEPNSVVAYIAASASWLAANAVDAAIERAEQAVRLEEPTPQGTTCRSWFTLATALYRQQSLLAPADRVWTRLDQAVTAAQNSIDDGTLADPWRVNLLLADCALARDRGIQSGLDQRTRALEFLQQAEAKYPATVELWESLPVAYERLGASADADRSFDRLTQLAGGAAKAAVVKVQLHVMRGEHQAAERALAAASKDPNLDSAVLQQQLLQLKLATSKSADTRQILAQAHQQSPQDLTILRKLAELDLEAHNLEGVQDWEKAMSSAGSAGEALALYCKIRRQLLDSKSPRDKAFRAAQEDLEQLLRLRPNWPDALSLSGLMEESQGNADAAILAYQRAIDLGEQRVGVFERLVSLLQKRPDEAAKVLSRLQSSVSLSQRLTVLSGALEVQGNHLDKAVELAKAGVKQRPQDPEAYVWLSRLLLENKQDAEAFESIQSALKWKPNSANAMTALFDYHMRRGEKAEAKAVLQQVAAKGDLPPAEIQFLLGQGYELLGERATAQGAYDKALEMSTDSIPVLLRAARFYSAQNVDKAIELAERAWKLNPGIEGVRQLYASFLSQRGSEDDWRKVDQLLSQNSASAAMSIDDNRARAILLGSRGGVRNLNTAVQILKDLIDKPESKPGDRLLLAQLYERQGRLADSPATAGRLIDEARAQLLMLAERSPPQPGHLITLIEFLHRHGRPDDAKVWLNNLSKQVALESEPSPRLLAECVRLALRLDEVDQAAKQLEALERREPDGLSGIALRAQLLQKQGKPQEAKTSIEASAGRLLAKATRPVEQASVCQGIGDLYATLKHYPEAEAWYEKLRKASPQQFDRTVLVLAEQGKFDQALRVCREQAEAKQEIPAALLAANVLARMQSKGDGSEGEAILDAARKQHPENLNLLSAEATLRVIQGNTGKAVELFRDLVEKNDRDPLALNNLATMLAEIESERDEALKLIDKALKIAGREPSLLDTKGTILLFKGDAEQAAANLEAAAREVDADPRYRFHLALAYRNLDRKADAKIELERAIARDLEKQILTAEERRLLAEVRSEFSL